MSPTAEIDWYKLLVNGFILLVVATYVGLLLSEAWETWRRRR